MPLERPSRRTILTLLVVAGLSLALDLVFGPFRAIRTDGDDGWQAGGSVPLPSPRGRSDVSVEEASPTGAPGASTADARSSGVNSGSCSGRRRA
jgi:hypothetical protein